MVIQIQYLEHSGDRDFVFSCYVLLAKVKYRILQGFQIAGERFLHKRYNTRKYKTQAKTRKGSWSTKYVYCFVWLFIYNVSISLLECVPLETADKDLECKHQLCNRPFH